MAIPTTTWNEALPASTEDVGDGDDRIVEYKIQFRELFDLEHIAPTTAVADAGTNGDHRVGAVGVVYKGTAANITTNAVNGDGDAVTGAVSYDTERNCMVYYTGSAWVPCVPYCAASVYGDTNVVLTTTYQALTEVSTTVSNIISGGSLLVIDVDVTHEATAAVATSVLYYVDIDGSQLQASVASAQYQRGRHIQCWKLASATSHAIKVYAKLSASGTVNNTSVKLVVTSYPVIAA